MPYCNNNIVSLIIKVNDIKDNPTFDVLASEQPVVSGVSGFDCNGGAADGDLLKEILQKVICAFPGKPISLCIDGHEIVRDARCPKPS